MELSAKSLGALRFARSVVPPLSSGWKWSTGGLQDQRGDRGEDTVKKTSEGRERQFSTMVALWRGPRR